MKFIISNLTVLFLAQPAFCFNSTESSNSIREDDTIFSTVKVCNDKFIANSIVALEDLTRNSVESLSTDGNSCLSFKGQRNIYEETFRTYKVTLKNNDQIVFGINITP